MIALSILAVIGWIAAIVLGIALKGAVDGVDDIRKQYDSHVADGRCEVITMVDDLKSTGVVDFKDDAKWLAYARIRQVRRARPSITADADSQLWRHRDGERDK